jgi:hypothetical protein
MTLYTTVLWFYAVMVSLVFGASIYESLVVHPAWSRKPPESFVGFVGSPVSRMNLPAFWMPVAPLYALSGLGVLAVALWAGSREVPLILSAMCAISVVAWTLAYFRPTIERFLEDGGGNTPAGRLQVMQLFHTCVASAVRAPHQEIATSTTRIQSRRIHRRAPD